MSRRIRDLFENIRSEGGLLPPDLLKRIADGDKDIPGLSPESYHLAKGERLTEMVNRSWNRLLGAWASFREAAEKLGEKDADAGVTRDRWLSIFFQELGYGQLEATPKAREIEGKAYPISHFRHASPIHLIGFRTKLDERSKGVRGAATQSPHSLVQEFLNRSDDHLWGFLSNGLQLRILRDTVSLTRQAYVEFDLEGMMEGEAYADFALLWLLAHQSRVEPRVRVSSADEGETAASGEPAPRPEECWLEQWSRVAAEQGTRAREDLRQGVKTAIEALGQGFLAWPKNDALREGLRTGTLDKQDYYRELLRVVYRLLFLFVAEDRDLLFSPGADAQAEARNRYEAWYSTRRLRSLAERRRGSPHADLYDGLRVVMEKLGSDSGCPELALPALGSFLWSRDAIPSLAEADVANRDLLEAVRALAFTEQDRRLRAVDYRNLGSEELGSVYESLLELHPDVDAQAHHFELSTSAGHERKTTGSYYTPTSLIQCLLDTALDPVIDEACEKEDPEQAILGLKVCDPACGSGHFLIAAAHRIARRLATVRTGEEEPAPDSLRAALRDSIAHCLYGVDVNPMAVELCKVSLWLEALQPGRPLSFLEHHIQCGNSLLGVTPALLAKGIPDAAFQPIEGDDRKFAAALKRRNAAERSGEQSWFSDFAAEAAPTYGTLRDSAASLSLLDDENIMAVHQKEEKYQALLRSEEFRRATIAADSWVAAPVWKKIADAPEPVTEEIVRRLASGQPVAPEITSEIDRLRKHFRFFHWHIAFPGVFSSSQSLDSKELSDAGWTGGFDAIVGNPPWEKFTVSDEEWFSGRHDEIAQTKGKARRDRLIAALEEEDPDLFSMFKQAKREEQYFTSLFTRKAGTYPLTGFRELNTYHLFAELAERLLAPNGRAGVIVKTGIGSAVNCLPLFKRLTQRRQLVSMYDFVNRKPLFVDVQTVERFSLLTFCGTRGHSGEMQFATLCEDVPDLDLEGRRYTLGPDDIQLMSPENGACPLLGSAADAQILRKVYRSFPVLGEENTQSADHHWNPSYCTIFHMANDSGEFKRLEEFEAAGVPVKAGQPVRLDDEEYWPLYEGKYIYLLDHRYGSFAGVPESRKYGRKASAPTPSVAELRDPSFEILPRYWFPRSRWTQRASAAGLRTDYHFLFRDVAGAYPDLRTAIGAICPAGPAGHKAPVLSIPSKGDEIEDVRRHLAFAAIFCSLPFDYIVRNKLYSKSLTKNVLWQIPMPAPADVVAGPDETDELRSALLRTAIELSYTTWSLQPIGDALGIHEPFIYDSEHRFALLRVIDAISAHLYGLEREEFSQVLSTFRTLRAHEERQFGEFLTERVALAEFDRLQLAAQPGIEESAPPRTGRDVS